MARVFLSVLFSMLVCAIGCGAAPETARNWAPEPQRMAKEATPGASDAAGVSDHPRGEDQKLPDNVSIKRKIIHRAEVDLVVEEFDTVAETIESLVKRHDGFVAASNVTGTRGTPRSGRWTIRVSVDRYTDFLAAVREIGEVRSINSTSDDVTGEYYDIEARIRNKKLEEDRLLKLLSDATGKLAEILMVEKELSRVRGEIEQMQGRMRVLNDLIDLTTVTVSVSEIKDYAPEPAPTYLVRVRRSFQNSMNAAISAAEGLSLAVVALVPWSPYLLVVLLIAYVIRRRFRRRQ